MLEEDVSTGMLEDKRGVSIEEDDKFAELSRSELEEDLLADDSVGSTSSPTLSLEEKMPVSLLDTLVSLSLDCGVTRVELLAGGSSAGPELLESEEQAKNPALAAVTIARNVENFLNIP